MVWPAYLMPSRHSASSLSDIIGRWFRFRWHRTAVFSWYSLAPASSAVHACMSRSSESNQDYDITYQSLFPSNAVIAYQTVMSVVSYGASPRCWKGFLLLPFGHGGVSSPATSSWLFLRTIAVGLMSVSADLVLDFVAMDSPTVSTLSSEMVFCAINHMLTILVWTGTQLQIAAIMVYDRMSWLTSMDTNDMVVVVLQPTGPGVREPQQIGGLIQVVIGISRVPLLLIRQCQRFARQGHIEFNGRWIDLRVDWVVLIESTVTVLAAESYPPMLQEHNV
jgi:hypothetical protein